MVTRIDWLPYKMDERLTVTRQVAANIDTYSAILGLTAAQVTRLKAIPLEIEFALEFAFLAKAASKAATSWRDGVLSSKRSNKLAAALPNFPSTPPPAGTRNGVIAEFRTLVAQIKASPGFTDAIGIAFNIMPPERAATPLREIEPKLDATAKPGYEVRIQGSLRGMDQMRIDGQRKGSAKWEWLAFLTTLPATITVEPSVDGEPESLRIRAVLLKKNKEVGQPSDVIPVTIFPL